jgi:hypothetical protein
LGVGARIRTDIRENGRSRSIYRWVGSGSSFGCNPLTRTEIGLGRAERIELLEVYWPTSDVTQQFRDVPLDRLIEIREDEKTFREVPLRRFTFAR